MTPENKQIFLEEALQARKDFTSVIIEDWMEVPPSERVKIEDLLIMYDNAINIKW